jgi:hypothetical protein
MTCRRCQGCMARDHFLDLQESGGEWWTEGWRCINCGHVLDPVLEKNRRLHAQATAVQEPIEAEAAVASAAEGRMDIAA